MISHSSVPTSAIQPASTDDRLYFHICESMDAFLKLEPMWRNLYDHSSITGPCSSWEWASAWWKHFAQAPPAGIERSMYVMMIRDDSDRLLAIAPYLIESQPKRPLQPRRLRPFGSLPRSRDPRLNVFAEEPVLVIRQGCERAVWLAIAEHASIGPSSMRWDEFELAALRDADVLDAVQARLAELAVECDPLGRYGSQIVHLPADWASYRMMLSKSMRELIPRYPRKLSHRTQDWRVREIRDPAQIEWATDEVVRLHAVRAHSARGLKHVDHVPCRHQKAFLRDTASTFARRGEAFVAVLEVHGAVVAAQLFFEMEGCVTFYYSGYETEYFDVAPITIIGQSVIRSAVERGVRRLNFLSGMEAWKTRWGAQEAEPITVLTGSARHARGRTLAGLRSAYRATRSLLKRA